jgi:predicted DNA-binding antitoxin AbrB/MazE fold protein
MTIDATCENGVFVPAQRPELAEHERVRLTIEPAPTAPAPAGTPDPGIVSKYRTRRTSIDAALSREIASSPDFLPEES